MTSTTPDNAALTLAIAGLGAIGLSVARAVDRGGIPGIALTAIAARDHDKAARNLSRFASKPDILPLSGLAEAADIVLECAPAAVFLESAVPAIERGRIFMPLSVGAMLAHMDLIDRARETGAQIMVPTGALLGLDAIKAIAEGDVQSVTLTTRKPPAGLKGAPYLAENGISIDGLTEPRRVFAGSARQAARGFPANVNVGAALSLAGIGPDATMVEIWADPTLTRNTHTVVAKSDSSNLTMTIESIPSAQSAATGKVTPQSAIALLRRLTAPLVVGS